MESFSLKGSSLIPTVTLTFQENDVNVFFCLVLLFFKYKNSHGQLYPLLKIQGSQMTPQ